jgi:hypothetical protein
MKSSAAQKKLTRAYLKAGHGKRGFCITQYKMRIRCVFCKEQTAKNWYLGDGGYCCSKCKRKIVAEQKKERR